MLKDLKLGFKIVKYGLQYKMMLGLMIAFIAIGVIFELFSGQNNLGGLYMIIASVYWYQLIITPGISASILASPKKKSLQTSTPSMVMGICSVLGFTLYLVCKYLRLTVFHPASATPEVIKAEITRILITAIIAFAMMAYSGAAYKKFIASLVVVLIFFLPIIMFSMNDYLPVLMFERLGLDKMPLSVTIIISYVLLVLGALSSYLLSLALFKYDFDPKTYRSALSRAGK